MGDALRFSNIDDITLIISSQKYDVCKIKIKHSNGKFENENYTDSTAINLKLLSVISKT